MNEFSLWDDTAAEVTAERTARQASLASAAVEPLWPYLSKASSLSEFENRLALQGDALLSRIATVIEDPTMQQDQIRLVSGDLRERFTAALRAREAQEAAQARENAVAAALRPVLADDHVAPTDHEAKPEWDTSTASDLCDICGWPVSKGKDGKWTHDAKNPVQWTDKRKDAKTSAKTAGFWDEISAQIQRLRSAKSADEVISILNDSQYVEAQEYKGDNTGPDAFFGGSGGDETVIGALKDAGWKTVWAEAPYYWVAQAPNGDKITYIEGDVYKGDTHVASKKTSARDTGNCSVCGRWASYDKSTRSWSHDEDGSSLCKGAGVKKASSRRTASWIDQARSVVQNKQMSGGLDMNTAHMLVQVYDGLGEANKAKFDAMPLDKAVDFGWKIVEKAQAKSASKTADLDPSSISEGDIVTYDQPWGGREGVRGRVLQVFRDQITGGLVVMLDQVGPPYSRDRVSLSAVTSVEKTANLHTADIRDWTRVRPGLFENGKGDQIWEDVVGGWWKTNKDKFDQGGFRSADEAEQKAAAKTAADEAWYVFDANDEVVNGPFDSQSQAQDALAEWQGNDPDNSGDLHVGIGVNYGGYVEKSAAKNNGAVYDSPADLPKPGDKVDGRGGMIGDDDVRDVTVVSVDGPYGPFPGGGSGGATTYHWDVKVDAGDGTQPYSQTWFTKSASKTTSRKTAQASDVCPKCGSHMDDVRVNGDILRARCDNCGWTGMKKRALYDSSEEPCCYAYVTSGGQFHEPGCPVGDRMKDPGHTMHSSRTASIEELGDDSLKAVYERAKANLAANPQAEDRQRQEWWLRQIEMEMHTRYQQKRQAMWRKVAEPQKGSPLEMNDGTEIRIDKDGWIGWMSDWGALYDKGWIDKGWVESEAHNSGGLGGASYRLTDEGRKQINASRRTAEWDMRCPASGNILGGSTSDATETACPYCGNHVTPVKDDRGISRIPDHQPGYLASRQADLLSRDPENDEWASHDQLAGNTGGSVHVYADDPEDKDEFRGPTPLDYLMHGLFPSGASASRHTAEGYDFNPFGGPDWDIFKVEVDDEGQSSYTIVDDDGVKHYLDDDAAAHLLDSLTGHSAPTDLSEKFEKKFGSLGVEALLASATEEEWLEVEGAFFHHPQAPNQPGPNSADDNIGIGGLSKSEWQLARDQAEQRRLKYEKDQQAEQAREAAFFDHPRHPMADPATRARVTDMQGDARTDRDAERATQRRHDEYWNAHPEEYQRHLRQNASIEQAVYRTPQGMVTLTSNGTHPIGYTVSTSWPGAHQAVNDAGYGSDRYQTLDAPATPAWINDEWQDNGPTPYLDIDRANPFSKETLERVQHQREVQAAAQRIAVDLEGFEQNDSFDDHGTSQPLTTRPRVVPQEHQTFPANTGLDDPGMAPSPLVGDPMAPTIDQAVAARVARLTATVLAENPTMDKAAARRLAAATVARYPDMVK